MFVLEKLIGVIAPHNCLSCGKEGSLICDSCALDVVVPLPSRCYLCKATTQSYAVCDKCRSKSHLRQVWVSSEYKGLAKSLLQFYKFERGQEGSKVIANYMAKLLPTTSSHQLILIPVPTATSRQRMRGYDHTRLLAQEISKQTNLPYELAVGRLGQSRQVGANRQDRLAQLDAAFYVKRPKTIEGQSIILVDDIVTTGGTLESVAKILRQAGAKSVNAIVFAQKS